MTLRESIEDLKNAARIARRARDAWEDLRSVTNREALDDALDELENAVAEVINAQNQTT